MGIRTGPVFAAMESFIYLQILFVLFAKYNPADGEECGGKPADVVFVLDTSSSIPMPDFRKQLQFVEDVVDVFAVAPDKMRVGLVLFSDKVYPEFSLTTHKTKASLKSAISSLYYKGGSTHTDKALAYVRDKIFETEGRDKVPKIAIVLTDGMSYNTTATTIQARAAHARGIVVFVVGIGNGVDHQELSAIASDPDSTYLRQLENFDVLDSFKKELAFKACKVQYKEPEPVMMPNDMGHPQCDVMAYFGLDTTGVSTRNTQRALEFLTAVTSRVTAQVPDASALQLMSECPEAEAKGIPGKSYASLFRKLRLMAQLKRGGDRHRMVAVLVIDSVINDDRDLSMEVTRAKFVGIEAVVMAVGNDLDPGQIASVLGLAGDSPDLRNRVVSADSYHTLGKAEEVLADVIIAVGECV